MFLKIGWSEGVELLQEFNEIEVFEKDFLLLVLLRVCVVLF